VQETNIFFTDYLTLDLSFSFSSSNIVWFVSHMFHFIWLNTVSFFSSPQDQASCGAAHIVLSLIHWLLRAVSVPVKWLEDKVDY